MSSSTVRCLPEPNPPERSITDMINDVCLMDKMQQCGVGLLEKDSVDWVQCSTCGGWYHCVCVGIDLQYFQDSQFCCCKPMTKNPMYGISILIDESYNCLTLPAAFCNFHLCAGRKSSSPSCIIVMCVPCTQDMGSAMALLIFFSSMVSSSTVFMTINDANLYFINSALLPTHDSEEIFLSALTYQGIQKAFCEGSGQKRKEAFRRVHRSCNGHTDIHKHSVVVFPCRLQ